MHNTNISENKGETVSLVKVFFCFCLYECLSDCQAGSPGQSWMWISISGYSADSGWGPVLLEGILVTFANWNYKPITKDVSIW